MKISTQTRYAMRFLVELALYESKSAADERLTIQQAAAKQGISGKYLESIVSKLKKAGLVNSLKGIKGGYRLAKPADDINLGDVMRLMETNYFERHCVDDPETHCPNYEDCVLVGYWCTLEDMITDLVDGITLRVIMEKINNDLEAIHSLL